MTVEVNLKRGNARRSVMRFKHPDSRIDDAPVQLSGASGYRLLCAVAGTPAGVRQEVIVVPRGASLAF